MQKAVGKTIAKIQSRGRGRPCSDEVNQNILHAAYELLMEVGYAQLKIEGVAARALVGKIVVATIPSDRTT